MTDDRKLAAKLTADRLTELEQELDAARSSTEPDWDRIEALSKEAAALFVQEEDVRNGKQALYAALAQQEKPSIRILRWGHFAAVAAVAGIALILVPAAIRLRHTIETKPPVQQTDVTEPAETTLSSETQTVTTAVTVNSQMNTQTETAPTETNHTETAAFVTGISAEQTSLTQNTSGTKKTETTASSVTRKTETKPTEPSSQHTEEETKQPIVTSPPEITNHHDNTGVDYTTCMDTTDVISQPQTVLIRTVDAADPSQTVPGAELQIYDMDGNLVLAFRSGSSPVQAELAPDAEYRLHAVSVPEGWQLPRRDMIFKLKNACFEILLKRSKEDSP